MRNYYFLFIVIVFAVARLGLTAQPTGTEADTAMEASKANYLNLNKSPTGAALRSLAVPGWGQLYVERYIHAPVFAGAAGFLWYNVISNHISYNKLKEEAAQYDNQSYEYQAADAKAVAAIDNRDLSMLYLLGVYVLAIVDAYSGAHLYDFEILNSSNGRLAGAVFLTPAAGFGPLAGQPQVRLGLTYLLGR